LATDRREQPMTKGHVAVAFVVGAAIGYYVGKKR
jgi:hypothetical protein